MDYREVLLLDFGLWYMDFWEDWTLVLVGLWTFGKVGHPTLDIRIWTTYSWTLDFGYWCRTQQRPTCNQVPKLSSRCTLL